MLSIFLICAPPQLLILYKNTTSNLIVIEGIYPINLNKFKKRINIKLKFNKIKTPGLYLLIIKFLKNLESFIKIFVKKRKYLKIKNIKLVNPKKNKIK